MKKTVQMGFMLSFALILSYIESLIPFSFGIPGMKLGVANFAIVGVLYLWGSKEALLVDIMKIVLTSFLFGNMSMMLYSLAGGLLSLAVMSGMKRSTLFSPIGVSMGGGVFHNIGQMIIAFFVVHTSGLLFYLPLLMLVGLATGVVIGILYMTMENRLMLIIRMGGY